ncbi:hypothetical protein M8494_11080 [Serratia ureilytica]
MQNGCNVQVTPLHQGEEEIVRLVTCFNEARAHFAAEQPLKIMLLQHGYVAEDDGTPAWRAEELNRFYHYFGVWFKNQRPVRQGADSAAERRRDRRHLLPAEMMRTNLAIGTANEVITRLKKYGRRWGMTSLRLWIDSGA